LAVCGEGTTVMFVAFASKVIWTSSVTPQSRGDLAVADGGQERCLELSGTTGMNPVAILQKAQSGWRATLRIWRLGYGMP
jgi:hypothetical protein